MKQPNKPISPLGGKKGPSGRKALVAKAGKRAGVRQAPPAPSRRPEIIKRVNEWIDLHTAKAYEPDFAIVIPSIERSLPPVRVTTIPGPFRWELLRATRTSAFTAKGNPSGVG